jgi:hypothetical protein
MGSPSALPAVPSASPAGEGAWTEIDLPDAVEVWRAAGVIADADGLVIYGFEADRPAAWTSSDASDWTAVGLPGREGFPSRAATSDDATVLIGQVSTSRCAHPSGELLWRRVHGDTTWRLVPFDQELFCAGGTPLIAARSHMFMVAGMGTGDQPFAWRSDDGLEWIDAMAGLPIDLPPWALGTTTDGFMELGRGERTDVRITVDGNDWTRVDAPPAPPAFGAELPGMDPVALINTSAGLLAVYAGGGASAAWRRDDAGAWVEVGLPEPTELAFSGGVAMRGDPYLFGTGGGRASIWTSTDLVSWREIPIPEVDLVIGLASFRGRAIVVTATADPDGEAESTTVFVGEFPIEN